MMSTRLALLLTAVAALGCADAPDPMAVVPPTRITSDGGCGIFTEGCSTQTATFSVASVDLVSGSILGTDGTRYYAADATRFHPVELPPNPILPNDPVYANLGAWNSLIGTSASFRAYLGLMRALPPNPIYPVDPVRYTAVALTDGTSYFLTEVTPVIVGP